MFNSVGSGDQETKIVQKWSSLFDQAFDSDDFAGSIGSRRFRNPSAYHVDQASYEVVHFILTGEKGETFNSALEDLCRLIALREQKASVTLAPFTKLRNMVAPLASSEQHAREMSDRIDECSLLAVDHYVQSRERVLQIRINELKRKASMLEKIVSSSESGIGGM